MNSHLIFKRDNTQYATFEFVNIAPEPEAVVILNLRAKRVLDNSNAPFLLEIWPFSQDFLLEILSELVF